MTTSTKTVKRQFAPDCIVVANAACARIFERDDDSQALREIADLVHTPSRQKASTLGDDRPGHALKGQASTSFAPHTALLEREHQRFAREVAQLLETAALDHRMSGLVLLASNPFLGELKAALGDAARKLLKRSTPLDLTTFSDRDLEQRVTRALGSAADEG